MTVTGRKTDSGTTTGYESELWATADALRGSMDAAEYKQEAAEDRDEYVAENIFWVPQEARWERLKAGARQTSIGQTVDQASKTDGNRSAAQTPRVASGRRPDLTVRR